MSIQPSIATLQRISAKSLSELLLAESGSAEPSAVAVVDVRDSDYIGGHVKGGIHVPIGNLDAMMPTLVRQLHGKETVVFHCALSQQRGPTAALRYLRQRDGAAKKLGLEPPTDAEGKPVEQKVYVLDRGFVGWQEVYGEDERLTEGYRKELWKDGYWG